MDDDTKKWIDDFNKSMDEWNKAFDERMKVAHDEWVEKNPAQAACDHGVCFDEDAFRQHENMSAEEVRKRFPRHFGECPKGCGYNGIAYASMLHYIAGDW